MKVTTEWKSDRFNVMLASKEGAEPFLTIYGCRLVSGEKGDFVGWPAQKNPQTEKWWNHCRGSDAFVAAVVDSAKASKPASAPSPKGRPKDVSDDDIPF